jgi:heme ABC exporter ATP-binding subunit CcmA
VTRFYGEHAALDRVTLEIPAGQSVALMGHNGAGKSTLLRLLAGLTRPSEGTVRLSDRAPSDIEARRSFGLLAHESYLYGALSARENLRLYGRLYALGELEERITEILAEVGLEWAADLPISAFSRGMEQRATLARVLLHDPSLLLLDEPFGGLDRMAEQFLADRLRRLARSGKTIVLVTHDPQRAIDLAERAVVLRRGRIILDANLQNGTASGFASRYLSLLAEGTQ